MMRSLFSQRHRDDAGVALVAATAVGIIGIMVATLVVAQTIEAVDNSARDRIRTIEIHGAEGAIDATMALLAFETPCPSPDFSPVEFGDGNQSTTIEVTIEYSSGGSVLACSGGTLADVPDRAVITARAEQTQDSLGIQAVRTLEATVGLEPHQSVSHSAAIYSAQQMTVSSYINITPQVLEEAADIWIDSGNYTCNNPSLFQGSLYLPQGGATFNNGCIVTHDLWTRDNLRVNGAPPSANMVGGNLTIRNGTLQSNTSVINIGGNVNVGGPYTLGGWQTLNTGGLAQFGLGAANIPSLDSVPLPEIRYVQSDWTGQGFTPRNRTDFHNYVVNQWNVPDYWQGTMNTGCRIEAYMSQYASRPNVLELPATPTVYNLGGCNPFLLNNTITLELYADTAFFVSSFNSTGTVTFRSGDGGDHRLWLIVPQNSSGFTPGNIHSSPQMSIEPPLTSFWYTPGTAEWRSNTSFRGQIYANRVSIASPITFVYDNVTVPGVELVSPNPSVSGFTVELLSKREVAN